VVVVSEEEGAVAVRWARASIEAALGRSASGGAPPIDREPRDAVFREPRGVFVTLKRHPSDLLRGCIGYPLPHFPLAWAIAQASVAAATEDPRFPAVRAGELAQLTVEVSILTVPVPVGGRTPEEIAAHLRVGRDGLIVEGHGTSGLLLPQVAPEQGWTASEFLDGTCEKAGLPAGAWRQAGVRIRRFEAEVFAETSPGGSVRRVAT
jgi:uncharacterized protein